MASAPGPKAPRETVRDFRARMRAQGLRPVTIWVPDVNSAEFKAEARRQSKLVAESEHEKDDMAFISSLHSWDDE